MVYCWQLLSCDLSIISNICKNFKNCVAISLNIKFKLLFTSQPSYLSFWLNYLNWATLFMLMHKIKILTRIRVSDVYSICQFKALVGSYKTSFRKLPNRKLTIQWIISLIWLIMAIFYSSFCQDYCFFLTITLASTKRYCFCQRSVANQQQTET